MGHKKSWEEVQGVFFDVRILLNNRSAEGKAGRTRLADQVRNVEANHKTTPLL